MAGWRRVVVWLLLLRREESDGGGLGRSGVRVWMLVGGVGLKRPESDVWVPTECGLERGALAEKCLGGVRGGDHGCAVIRE